LLLAVASVILLYGVFEAKYGAIYISVLVAADVCVLVGYVAYQVDRTVLRPLRQAMAAAEAIAEGDLARRLPPGDTHEMSNLADSVNRMTDHLIEDRAHLVRAEKMASVGRLAAGVAHEIGNPLGAINGYTHVLKTAPSDSKDGKDALAGLERESARIDRIVRGLLDYARARPRAQGAVDLNDTARMIVELLTTQGVLKHIDLELSPAADATMVAGDRHDLEQAFVNLLLNAVDAMQGKGSLSIIIRRTTRLELKAGGRRSDGAPGTRVHPPDARTLRWLDAGGPDEIAMVAVTDSGPGIPPEDVERVFEPFYTTKDPGKGTGLGLAIVARAIDNFGGTIWVSPAREGGAAFRILLPVMSTSKRVSVPRVRVSNERLALS
jgi:signal transduction histidine kinase